MGLYLCSAIKQQRQLLTFFLVDEERCSVRSEKFTVEQCNVGGSSLMQVPHNDVTLSGENRLICIPETNPKVTIKVISNDITTQGC